MFSSTKAILGLLASFIIMMSVNLAVAADRPFLGLQIQGLDERINHALGQDDLKGVMIRDIAFPGPSSQAGMQRGDIIIEVNGKAVDTVEQLVKISSKFKTGQVVKVVLLRGAKKVDLDVTVNPMPKAWQIERNSVATYPALGITFVALTEKVRKRFELGWSKRGVVISLMDPEKSQGLDIKVGEVIVQVNQRDVWEPKHIVQHLRKAQKEKREKILLLVNGPQGYRYTLMPVAQ